MMNNQKIILALVALFAVGTMTLVQQNATNQTGTGYNYSAQAKPDTSKFCAETLNDDGTTSHCTSTYKSKGECKKTGSELHGPDFAGCVKNSDNGKNKGGNDLTGDEDGEGSGSGPEPDTPEEVDGNN